MKLIPMLFSTDMVQAERAGRKKMTRRLKGLEMINENPDAWVYIRFHDGVAKFWQLNNALDEKYIKCPYGQPGDVLWVKENYFSFGKWTTPYKVFTKTGKQKFVFVTENDEVRYMEDELAGVIGKQRNLLSMPGWYKRLARFMPRKYCRTFLRITSIRVERLHDISEDDCIAEGIEPYDKVVNDRKFFKNYLYKDATQCKSPQWLDFPIESFESLIISIHNEATWKLNPWVWVISFEQTERPC